MRTLQLSLALIFVAGCSHNPPDPQAPCPESDQNSIFSDKNWSDIETQLESRELQRQATDDEIVVWPVSLVRGRWSADWEGAIFQECSHGRILGVRGSQERLFQVLNLRNPPKNWAGCLDVKALGSITIHPGWIPSGPFLNIDKIVSAEIAGHVKLDHDSCIDWSQ